MTDKEIRTEIERLRKADEVSGDKEYAQYELDVKCGYDMALDDILSFINSISEEPISESIDFEKELYKAFGQVKDFTLGMRIARHFYEAGAQWKKVKSIVDVCYHLEIRLPEHLDYNGVRVERKDFIEDIKKALKED